MAKACSQRSTEKQLFEWTTSEVELLLETVKSFTLPYFFPKSSLCLSISISDFPALRGRHDMFHNSLFPSYVVVGRKMKQQKI